MCICACIHVVCVKYNMYMRTCRCDIERKRGGGREGGREGERGKTLIHVKRCNLAVVVTVCCFSSQNMIYMYHNKYI